MSTAPNNYYGAGQISLDVPFDGATTADEIVDISNVDLTGKIIIITGGYVGLGLEITRSLARTNATLILGARRVDAAREAVSSLLAEGIHIEIEPLDLSSRTSVIEFATKFVNSGRALEILINNAGVGQKPLSYDEYGNERLLTLNHLGPALLTILLLPALRLTKGSIPRVVNVCSLAARCANVPQLLSDPNFEHHPYDGQFSYGQSKAAQVLFTVELDARARALDIPLHVYALHPGAIFETAFMDGMGQDYYDMLQREYQFLNPDGTIAYDPNGRGVKNCQQGASTAVFAAIYPPLGNVTSGVFLDNNNITQITPNDVEPGDMLNHGMYSVLYDPQNAQKLWQVTEKLLGMTFKLE